MILILCIVEFLSIVALMYILYCAGINVKQMDSDIRYLEMQRGDMEIEISKLHFYNKDLTDVNETLTAENEQLQKDKKLIEEENASVYEQIQNLNKEYKILLNKYKQATSKRTTLKGKK